MSSGAGLPEADDVAKRISKEIAAIHEESYGEPVGSIQTHLLGDAVVCVIDVGLLPLERTLLEGGKGEDAVCRVRKEFQSSIGPTFMAAVEHMTGRRVIGFLSDTHLDPPFTLEFFKLAPADNREALPQTGPPPG